MAAVLVLASCSSEKESEEQDEETTTKYLVLYYSQHEGTTKAVAEEFQKMLGADIEGIALEQPYDGDYAQTIERGQEERQNGETPALLPLQLNPADYDVIFLGYPIWFGTYALPIATLLNQYDFDGKTVVPFCTFGSGGLESSVEDLKKALPKATIAEGYGVRSERIMAAPEEINRFLIENGYIEGEIEALPEYSEQAPVTDKDKAIFDAACSSYRYPIGVPETVGKRTTSSGTDYCFKVKSDRSESLITVYVTIGNEPDSKPEFTKVVR